MPEARTPPASSLSSRARRLESTAPPLVRFEAVSKSFAGVSAVEGLSLDIFPGEFFALLGPSGCGKTTLLRLLAGLETLDGGRILLDGRDLAAVPPHRRPVNMMFQSYALFPHLDVERHVALDVEMGKQRVALEHHIDGPPVRRHRCEVAPVEQDAAGIERLETRQQAQQRGLAAARGAEQGEELAGEDVEREPFDRAHSDKALADRLEPHQRRRCALQAACARDK